MMRFLNPPLKAFSLTKLPEEQDFIFPLYYSKAQIALGQRSPELSPIPFQSRGWDVLGHSSGCYHGGARLPTKSPKVNLQPPCPIKDVCSPRRHFCT